MRLLRVNSHFRLESAPAAMYAAARKIPGMRPKAAPGGYAYEGYRDAVAVLLQSLGAGHVAAGLEEWSSDPVLASRLPEGLHAYQREGALRLASRAHEGVLLADDTGLGKTATALAAARYLDPGRMLVVCPSFVRSVWGVGERSEVKRWWPARFPPVVLGSRAAKADRLPERGIVVCHYDILAAWSEVLEGWDPELVIFDELHMLGSAISQRAKAAKMVAGVARWRIGLTATPLNNRPKDLWNPVDTISPGRFGKEWDFFRRHCDPKQVQIGEFKQVWDLSGSARLEELHARLSFFMVRRTKSEVELQLPPMTRQVLTQQIGRVQPLDIATLENKTELRAALAQAADSKRDWAVEILEEHAASHNVVCFVYRRETAEHLTTMLQAHGHDAVYIHGGIDQEKRQQIVDGKPQILIATIDSCGVGISMAYADVAVFAELDYVPRKLIQAEGRLNRQGQRRNVLVQYLIAEGTADEWIAEAVIGKLGVMGEVLGDSDDGLQRDLEGEEEESLQRLGALLLKGG